jgi:hypothetical protein
MLDYRVSQLFFREASWSSNVPDVCIGIMHSRSDGSRLDLLLLSLALVKLRFIDSVSALGKNMIYNNRLLFI